MKYFLENYRDKVILENPTILKSKDDYEIGFQFLAEYYTY